MGPRGHKVHPYIPRCDPIMGNIEEHMGKRCPKPLFVPHCLQKVNMFFMTNPLQRVGSCCFLKLDSSLFGRTCRLGGSPIGRHFVFPKRTSSSTLGGTQLAHLRPASPTDRGWLIISRPPDPKNGDLPSQMGI